jgi:cation/acetate symporter
MAAGLSTVAGLLVAGASAIAHDWYAAVLKPDCTDKQELMVGRIVTAALCGIVILIALNPPALIAQIVAMAFSIAGNTIFPVVVLGIWYSKSNKYGAVASMIWGLGMTLLAMTGWMLGIEFFGPDGLIPATSSALIVCPIGFLINIIVSNVMAEKISDETADKSDDILRKLHNLPGYVNEPPAKGSAFSR